MGLLNKSVEEKLNKSGRKWEECPEWIPYRAAYLFCEECGVKLGSYDIICTDLDTIKYCGNCVKKYKKDVPFCMPFGDVIDDIGSSVLVEYVDNYYSKLQVWKICYFNKKGRYIKVKGKRYYI